jgi:hypothetical protein
MEVTLIIDGLLKNLNVVLDDLVNVISDERAVETILGVLVAINTNK